MRYRDKGLLQGEPRDDDAGNGACMRNLPVILATLFTPNNFTDWTLQQSHITHHHSLSDAATLALGRMTQRLILDEGLAACGAEVENLIGQFDCFKFQPYPGKSSGFIVDTVQTVLHNFFNTDNFEDCLIATINQGGDADTTGALAGMLAGAKYGLANIPNRWLAKLDKSVSEQIRKQTLALITKPC